MDQDLNPTVSDHANAFLDNHEALLAALSGIGNPAAIMARAQSLIREEKHKQLKLSQQQQQQQHQQQLQQQTSPKMRSLAAATKRANSASEDDSVIGQIFLTWAKIQHLGNILNQIILGIKLLGQCCFG